MGIVKNSIGLAGVAGGCYYVLSKTLESMVPECSAGLMPSDMLVHKHLKSDAKKGSYIAYCHTFNLKLKNKDIGLERLDEKLFSDATMKQGSGVLEKSYEEVKRSFWGDTFKHLFRWRWKDPSIVSFFEKVASWGYPFRLMNGGVQEVYFCRKKGSDEVNVFFANAHEYTDLGDGKVIPQWVQHAHKTFARFILWKVFLKGQDS